MKLSKELLYAYGAGVLTIIVGGLLMDKSPAAAGTLLTTGGAWLGLLNKQPRFAKKAAKAANLPADDITPPPVTPEQTKKP